VDQRLRFSYALGTGRAVELDESDEEIPEEDVEKPEDFAPEGSEPLLVCFTHFDAVKGANLPNPRAREQHVLTSAENASVRSEKTWGHPRTETSSCTRLCRL
jgi:hypothetical protein